MTHKQKDDLAFFVINATIDRIDLEQEHNVLPEALKDLTREELLIQLALWFKKLPGTAWHVALPNC